MAAEPETINKPKPAIVHKARWHQRLAGFLIWSFIQLVSRTVRYQLDDRSGFFTGPPKERLVFAVWHNRLALSLILYQRYVQKHSPERRVTTLVSASKDGGLLAHTMELFGAKPVRGSSSRRGAQALREMIALGQRGFDLALTPDGPRGPCYHVQDGVVTAAQMTGLLIVPVSYHLSHKIRLKSWDRFQVPLPFCRCEISVAEPIRVPRELTDSEREDYRTQVELVMRGITRD